MDSIGRLTHLTGMSASFKKQRSLKITLLACAIKFIIFPGTACAVIVDELAESRGVTIIDGEYLSKSKAKKSTAAKTTTAKPATSSTTKKSTTTSKVTTSPQKTGVAAKSATTSSVRPANAAQKTGATAMASSASGNTAGRSQVSASATTAISTTQRQSTSAGGQRQRAVTNTSTQIKPTVTTTSQQITTAELEQTTNRQTSVEPSVQGAGITPSVATAVAQNNLSSDQDYFFDDSLILGSASTYGGIARFNQKGGMLAGNYEVDVFLNGKYKDHRVLKFAELTDQTIGPCLDQAFFDSVDALKVNPVNAECVPINQYIDGAFVNYDASLLRLNVSIPQAMLKQHPKGYVDPNNWVAGDSIAFVNYSSTSSYTSTTDNTNSYLGLSSGINLGLWRFRQQSSYTYNDDAGSHWRSIRAYAQRAIPAINSELTAGQSFTSGKFLSGMAFRGVELASDERMYPYSQQGYAPIVRGVAKSNATVLIRQGNNLLYQTTVPAGPFEITDIAPTNYGGDLEVEVQEADGQSFFFSVPFSALPESLREGSMRYSFVVGQARSVGDGKDWFGEINYQYGLNNAITLNAASRVGERYYSLMLGDTYSNWLGSFGTNVTYSYAKMPNNKTENGWMANISYSRTIQATGTTVTFAGYRYSSKGYRDYSDVIGARHAYEDDVQWSSSTYLQRARLDIIINQALDKYGQLFVSASKQYYRDDRDDDNQLQAGYSNSWGELAYSIRFSRVYNAASDKHENTVSAALSMPLGNGMHAPLVSVSGSRYTGAEHDIQGSVSGLLDEANTLSYTANVGYDSYSDNTQWGASLSKRYPVINVTGNYNNLGGSKWNGSFGLRGAVAAHSGGVTFGSYVSDTFALVEAKGAAGAKVASGNDIRIDRFGYAIVPSLSPYRYNSITLDSDGLDNNVELKDNQRVVAPYAGAVVKVKFDTISGYPVLISTRRTGDGSLPIGANVYNSQGIVIGMVGQGAQIYARTEDAKGRLLVKWGDAPDEQCVIDYIIANPNSNENLHRLNGVCQDVNEI